MPTGPHHYREANRLLKVAHEADPSVSANLSLEAIGHSLQALTAVVVMLTEAQPNQLYEVDGWRQVIPRAPLPECRSKEARRPECADRHTDDCAYTDPPPEPKHELLPVGTRVLVSDAVWDTDTRKALLKNPEPGRIVGYDTHKTKYRWQREWNWEEGRYFSHDQWAFADNRVEVHPDGPECSPASEPVKWEPTGPRIYVQHTNGTQGYVREIATREGRTQAQVHAHWFGPDSMWPWVNLSEVCFIPAEDVQRCKNGQTLDECSEGEDQCELCRQAEDEEAAEIEESMGLR